MNATAVAGRRSTDPALGPPNVRHTFRPTIGNVHKGSRLAVLTEAFCQARCLNDYRP